MSKVFLNTGILKKVNIEVFDPPAKRAEDLKFFQVRLIKYYVSDEGRLKTDFVRNRILNEIQKLEVKIKELESYE